MDTAEIIKFIVIALLAGTAASQVLERGRSTRRWLRNIIVGGLGALLGQFLFDALDIGAPRILSAEISLAEVLIAFIGAVLVILILRSLKRL